MSTPSFARMASFAALSRALDKAARGKRHRRTMAEVLVERERILLTLEERAPISYLSAWTVPHVRNL